MLTVKHIANDGTETLVEGEKIEKVHTGDRFMDAIYVDRQPEDLADTTCPGRSARHTFRFGTGDDGPTPGPMVYVMNRFGATVATYHL